MNDNHYESEVDIINKYKTGQLDGLYFSGLAYYLPVRVTGTGETVRVADGKYYVMDRKASEFLTKNFVEQCKSLPITEEHPDDSLLTPETFDKAKIVGQTVHAYIKDDEVWAIAKVFDGDLINNKLGNQIKSTSPGVSSKNDIILYGAYQETDGIINHLAFVECGHWDQVSPDAYKLDSMKGENKQMSQKEEVKLSTGSEDLEVINQKLDSLSASIDISKKLDAIHSKLDSTPINVVNDEKEEGTHHEQPTADEKTDTEEEVKNDEETSASETQVVDEVGEEPEHIDEDEEEHIDEDDGDKEKNDSYCDKARALCDAAPYDMDLKMSKFEDNRSSYDNLRRFLKLNRHLVDSKYQGILDAKLDSDLNRRLLVDAYNTLCDDVESAIEREKKYDSEGQKGVFVDSGKGYFVDRSF